VYSTADAPGLRQKPSPWRPCASFSLDTVSVRRVPSLPRLIGRFGREALGEQQTVGGDGRTSSWAIQTQHSGDPLPRCFKIVIGVWRVATQFRIMRSASRGRRALLRGRSGSVAGRAVQAPHTPPNTTPKKTWERPCSCRYEQLHENCCTKNATSFQKVGSIDIAMSCREHWAE